MKRHYFILLLLYYILPLTSVYPQDNQKAITLFSHVKLKKIPIAVGMPFNVKEYCAIQVDSILHAERYFFENATIGKIKSCKMDFAMRNDTVQSITIYLTGHKNYNAAMKLAQKEFGHAVVLMDVNEEMYTWQTKNVQGDVLVMLQRKNQEWGAELVVKSEE